MCQERFEEGNMIFTWQLGLFDEDFSVYFTTDVDFSLEGELLTKSASALSCTVALSSWSDPVGLGLLTLPKKKKKLIIVHPPKPIPSFLFSCIGPHPAPPKKKTWLLRHRNKTRIFKFSVEFVRFASTAMLV